MASDPLCIRIRHNYGDFLLDVNLELPSRGVTAIFGGSGSGKTTLLRFIAGLIPSKKGKVVVGEKIWQKDSYFLPTYKRQLGYVFQEPSLFSHLTVMGNLEYALKRRKKEGHLLGLKELIDLFDLETLLKRNTSEISGGERQRVAIARALLTGPKLLLMDEPMASMDDFRKEEFLPYLEKLYQTLRIPILYVSHSTYEVERLADYIVILDEGLCVYRGPLRGKVPRISEKKYPENLMT